MAHIIGVHIGQCGTKIGQRMWDQLAQQHQIYKQTPQGNVSACFHQTKNNYKANSLFVDVDYQAYDNISSRDSNQLHQQKNIITQKYCSRNLYSEAMYNFGFDMKIKIQQRLKRVKEHFDVRSDFILTAGVGGGIGSGMTSQVFSLISDLYPQSIQHLNMVIPNLDICSPLQIYNYVLCYVPLIDVHLCTIFQNKNAQQILRCQKNSLTINLEDINKCFGHAICQLTSGFRFAGQLNSSYRKVHHNLILFPRLHYLMQSITPIKPFRNINPIQQALCSKNFLGIMNDPAKKYKYFTMSVVCRDPFVYEQEIYKQIDKFGLQNLQWLPNNCHLTLCNKYNQANRSSVSLLVNSTEIIQHLQKLKEKFNRLYLRRAFMHHYLTSGVDYLQLTQSEACIQQIIEEYAHYSFSNSNYEENDDIQ